MSLDTLRNEMAELQRAEAAAASEAAANLRDLIGCESDGAILPIHWRRSPSIHERRSPWIHEPEHGMFFILDLINFLTLY